MKKVDKTHILYQKLNIFREKGMNKRFFEKVGDFSGMRLETAGLCCQFPALAPLKTDVHRHDVWQLDLCLQGEAEIFVGSSCYKAAQGDIVIISPGLEHRIVYPAAQKFMCWSFKCSAPWNSAPRIVVAGGADCRRERTALIRAADELCRGFFPAELIGSNRSFAVSEGFDFLAALTSLLTAIVMRCFFDSPGGGGECDLPERISRYVHNRGGAGIKISELAKEFHCSAGHLRVLMYQQCGIGTKEFVDRKRAEIAQKMLLYSDMRVNELAGSMGFEDVKYFSRFFKKYTGLLPSEFIRSKRKGHSFPSG